MRIERFEEEAVGMKQKEQTNIGKQTGGFRRQCRKQRRTR